MVKGGKGRGKGGSIGKGREGEDRERTGGRKTLWICPPPENFLATPLPRALP